MNLANCLTRFSIKTLSLFSDETIPNWIPLLLFIIISSALAGSIGVYMLCREVKLPEIPNISPFPNEIDDDMSVNSTSYYNKGYAVDYDEEDPQMFVRTAASSFHRSNRGGSAPVINLNTQQL